MTARCSTRCAAAGAVLAAIFAAALPGCGDTPRTVSAPVDLSTGPVAKPQMTKIEAPAAPSKKR